MRFYIITILIALGFMFSGTVFAENVVLLEDGIFESVGESSDSVQENFGAYVNSILRLTIGIAAVLAVIQITIGGLERMTKDSVQSTTDGKKRIQAAIVGLLLAVASVLILTTINRDLLNFDLTQVIKNVTDESGGGTGGGGGSGGDTSPNDQCFNCKKLEGVPIKSGICGGNTSDCVISDQILGDLQKLNNTSDEPWRITEANPNSYTHQCSCHARGTCVDANLTNPATGARINSFINSAVASGLNPVYEVKTDAERDRFIAEGVDPNRIKTIPQISAPHFSLYGRGGCSN